MGAVVKQTQPIRLLLVEDEFLISEMVAEDLTEQGFSVCAVSNARDALSRLASAAVDILFTDVNLPGGMDGMALARCAREMNPHLPVVYASGHVGAFGLDACVPGSIFIAKPYLPSVVGRVLATAINAAATRARAGSQTRVMASMNAA
jgi:two-component system, response regulator PdtaR